ncbi:hypothetical protein GUITHDRAFT_67599 [Guillardia theta CCMP2712]|uniref:serine--tRNA ligase n=1 Tax=Guillardia theta (strain CCMP2712) TaxID=905079 RepID=L1JMJ5_GUITC|nr:hypothetical protein GUITHDRAFT_67599 [Guillardia theta CCMP2712]EKX49677.1 hypothetical protein GUITHDRAFT_67599 [Guillardia theta CCMP2712]|eukprot:XP_005836657.1 hypothetical protein GUITHDRAFT_67599 [Guillardia theta CCMP2712]
MLDINGFREEKGGDPEKVRESQRRRHKDVQIVDKVIEADVQWRQLQFKVDNLRGDYGKVNKEVAMKKKAGENADELIAKAKEIDAEIKAAEELCNKCMAERDEMLCKIGNLVPDSVPVSDDEDNNAIIRTFALEKVLQTESVPEFKIVKELDAAASKHEGKLSHVDLVPMLGLADTERGAAIAGNRGYFLVGDGVLLNQALISYGLAFLCPRGYVPIQTPFFMQKDAMAAVAQLAQFDEELYKVSGEGDDKYLIATSEQPICAYHRNLWVDPKELPRKYVGISTCFRKEVGSHGRDTLGIFRVHQFEKIEQFCVTSPEDNKSWEMLEEMIGTSEEFYKSLGIPYRVVAIVSGALNDAAAKKYDLEAWFPGSGAYRELVSCSNCTDYQARRVETRFGASAAQKKQSYVHMLNSTLTATERTLCCLVENYQTEDGMNVPEVLQPFMGGKKFIPFVNPKPVEKKDKKK